MRKIVMERKEDDEINDLSGTKESKAAALLVKQAAGKRIRNASMDTLFRKKNKHTGTEDDNDEQNEQEGDSVATTDATPSSVTSASSVSSAGGGLSTKTSSTGVSGGNKNAVDHSARRGNKNGSGGAAVMTDLIDLLTVSDRKDNEREELRLASEDKALALQKEIFRFHKETAQREATFREMQMSLQHAQHAQAERDKAVQNYLALKAGGCHDPTAELSRIYAIIPSTATARAPPPVAPLFTSPPPPPPPVPASSSSSPPNIPPPTTTTTDV